ncbi:hypothetical protein M9H77_16152 [Catharanthus roseus]|uniref:Uncharacterized protein n=1 Tax=Catharanthus roseus TaxID=4058 RepID=A0ACC0B0T5_CATRO|nr:hypothetical protein M9H77_16152 [Catharanthus roseus]
MQMLVMAKILKKEVQVEGKEKQKGYPLEVGFKKLGLQIGRDIAFDDRLLNHILETPQDGIRFYTKNKKCFDQNLYSERRFEEIFTRREVLKSHDNRNIYNQQSFKRIGFEKNEEGAFIRGGQEGDDDDEKDDDEDQEGMNVEEEESEEETEVEIHRRETRQKKRQERIEEGSSSGSMSQLMDMIASLQTSINTRFDTFDGRFEVLDGKVSNIQERLDALDHKMTNTQEQDKFKSFYFRTGRPILGTGLPIFLFTNHETTDEDSLDTNIRQFY